MRGGDRGAERRILVARKREIRVSAEEIGEERKKKKGEKQAKRRE